MVTQTMPFCMTLNNFPFWFVGLGLPDDFGKTLEDCNGNGGRLADGMGPQEAEGKSSLTDP